MPRDRRSGSGGVRGHGEVAPSSPANGRHSVSTWSACGQLRNSTVGTAQLANDYEVEERLLYVAQANRAGATKNPKPCNAKAGRSLPRIPPYPPTRWRKANCDTGKQGGSSTKSQAMHRKGRPITTSRSSPPGASVKPASTSAAARSWSRPPPASAAYLALNERHASNLWGCQSSRGCSCCRTRGKFASKHEGVAQGGASGENDVFGPTDCHCTTAMRSVLRWQGEA